MNGDTWIYNSPTEELMSGECHHLNVRGHDPPGEVQE